MLFDLVRGDSGRAVVGHGGGHDEGVSVHGVCLDGLKQVGGGGERNGLYKRHGRKRAAGGRQQRDVCAAQHTGAGHGVAHLAGGVVRQVAHGVHRLLRGTGRDDDLFAFKVFRAGQLPQDVVDQHTLIGQTARADVAAGQHTGAGRDDREAVVFQRFEVILGDGVFEHVGVHGGRDELGAGRGQRDGGQHVVGLTVGQLGDNIGRGRGDEHQICRVGKADMGHVVLEVAVKRIDLAAAAGQRLKHQRRDKLSGVFRHKNVYIRAQLDECMRHVGHFVGGNAPGDAEDNGFVGKQHKKSTPY